MAPVSSSQEQDPRFSVFLNPIRDLTKNWEVDIAKYLEEYLEELTEVQITFDDGVTTMNFAEAAMLIQGSATVYSKKVEFLWQMVLQMLDLLSSRRKVEASVTGDKGDEYEPVKGGKGHVTLEFSNCDSLGIGRNINLNEDDDRDDSFENKKKGFKFLEATPLHLVEKDAEKAQYRIPLFMKNGELFGSKDDFRINRSYLSPAGMLHMDVPAEILKGGRITPDIPEEDEGVETAAAGGEDGAPASPEDGGPPSPMAEEATPEEAPKEDPLPNLPLEQPPTSHDPSTTQPQTIDPATQEGLDKTKEEMTNNNNNLTIIDVPNGRYGMRKRDKKEVVAQIKLTEPWKPIDPHAETPARLPVRAGRLRRPLPCTCHRTKQVVVDRKRKKKKVSEEDKKPSKGLPPIEEFITGVLAGVTNVAAGRRKADKVDSGLVEEMKREVAQRLELGKNKQVKALIKEGGLGLEEALEKVAEDAALALTHQLEDDPLDHDDDPPPDLDCEGEGEERLLPPPLLLPDPHTMLPGGPQFPQPSTRLNDSLNEEPASEYEALVQRWVADYVTNAQEQINSDALIKRVNKWKETITPKLKKEEARQEFDIHSYGSQVLSHFPENGRKQTIAFSEVVANQEPQEVSRLFLSCLMLANTYNIELSESEPGDLAMDCLDLTLLSRARHHEELQEYAAPSQMQSPKRKNNKCRSAGETSKVCADITHTALTNNIPPHPGEEASSLRMVKNKR